LPRESNPLYIINNINRIFRAKRAVSETSIDGESKTQANSNQKETTTEKDEADFKNKGALALFPGLIVPKTATAPISFNFTVGSNPFFKKDLFKGSEEDSKKAESANEGPSFKSMKLNDEKKFFVQKNLFEN
jgi:hypothetical protein